MRVLEQNLAENNRLLGALRAAEARTPLWDCPRQTLFTEEIGRLEGIRQALGEQIRRLYDQIKALRNAAAAGTCAVVATATTVGTAEISATGLATMGTALGATTTAGAVATGAAVTVGAAAATAALSAGVGYGLGKIPIPFTGTNVHEALGSGIYAIYSFFGGGG